jgi:hypothetical protein
MTVVNLNNDLNHETFQQSLKKKHANVHALLENTIQT